MSQVHHSDVIGSLLRPKYLTQARDAYAAGQLSAPQFKRIEDRAVDQAIAMQEGIGLDVVTDGEFRRFSFLDQVVGEINGVEPIEGAPVHFKNATAGLGLAQPVHRDRQDQPEAEDHPGGVRLQPGPGDQAGQGHLPVPAAVLLGLVARAVHRGLPGRLSSCSRTRPTSSGPSAQALAELGCTYIQIDAPDIGSIVDPENRELRESLGHADRADAHRGPGHLQQRRRRPRRHVRRARLQGQQHEPVDQRRRVRADRRGHVRPG